MSNEEKGHGRKHSWRNKRFDLEIILDILQVILETSIKIVSLSTAGVNGVDSVRRGDISSSQIKETTSGFTVRRISRPIGSHSSLSTHLHVFIRQLSQPNPLTWRLPPDIYVIFSKNKFPLYYSEPPNIVRVIKSRRMRWAGHVAHMEEGRGVHKVLVGKPEGKRPLGRPRRRWEDNIKMDLEEVEGVMGTGWSWLWIGTWWALVSTVMNFRFP